MLRRLTPVDPSSPLQVPLADRASTCVMAWRLIQHRFAEFAAAAAAVDLSLVGVFVFPGEIWGRGGKCGKQERVESHMNGWKSNQRRWK